LKLCKEIGGVFVFNLFILSKGHIMMMMMMCLKLKTWLQGRQWHWKIMWF